MGVSVGSVGSAEGDSVSWEGETVKAVGDKVSPDDVGKRLGLALFRVGEGVGSSVNEEGESVRPVGGTVYPACVGHFEGASEKEGASVDDDRKRVYPPNDGL